MWSDGRVEQAIRLWGEGRSASEIAEIIGEGLTRNAVICKLHRSLPFAARAHMQDQNKRLTVHTPLPAPTMPRQVMYKPAADGALRTVPLPIEALSLTFEDLVVDQCHWPVERTEEGATIFCGAPAHGSYCRAHEALAYRPGTATNARRHRRVVHAA